MLVTQRSADTATGIYLTKSQISVTLAPAHALFGLYSRLFASCFADFSVVGARARRRRRGMCEDEETVCLQVFTFAALPCLRVAPDERPLARTPRPSSSLSRRLAPHSPWWKMVALFFQTQPDTPVWSSRWPLSGPVTVVGMSPAPRVVRTVSSAAASQPKYTQQSVCATLGMDERAVSTESPRLSFSSWVSRDRLSDSARTLTVDFKRTHHVAVGERFHAVDRHRIAGLDQDGPRRR